MIQVDMVGFYFMGSGLHELKGLRAAGLNRKLEILASGLYWLSQFLTPRSVLQFNQAKVMAEHLQDEVRAAVPLVNVDTGELAEEVVFRIETFLDKFGDALAHEIKSFLVFYLPQEGIYSVADLASNAEKAISEAARSKLTKEALDDFREGGRCLAFRFNTAAGFHLLRAVERMLRLYFKSMTGLDADQGHFDWGTCIAQLRKTQRADQKVMAVLDQIRSLHRNPLMHPEVFLNPDEARGIFQISSTAIDAIGRSLP